MRELPRQVLLDHHRAVQTHIPCQIRDAEAPDAKHALDQELLQASAGREFLAAGGEAWGEGGVAHDLI